MRIQLDCSAKIQADLEQLRDDYILNDKSQKLVLISIATNEMIQLYPDVWFMDTTAGMYDAIFGVFPCILMNTFDVCIHLLSPCWSGSI